MSKGGRIHPYLKVLSEDIWDKIPGEQGFLRDDVDWKAVWP